MTEINDYTPHDPRVSALETLARMTVWAFFAAYCMYKAVRYADDSNL